MRFMRNSRASAEDMDCDDPMSGVVNLFDTAVIFIAALMLALITAFEVKDLFSKDSNMTLVKRSSSGEMVLIEKKGRKIQAMKMTREEGAGKGIRLGTAYRLEDGSMIYVPEE
ncbi:MAG: hypothetical protein BWY31_00513 [Lentisphaerae bacterium ADurb.Bin242]|nr:MAG: hypothetical protein BWY31_00513 [Lentisphaerae bacterium ADurb.Bin242]